MTLAPNELKKVEFLIPSAFADKQLEQLNGFYLESFSHPFHDLVILFLDELSKTLINIGTAHHYSELISLGYWIRPAQVKKFTRSVRNSESSVVKPLGTVLHIAPSNVDIQFFYSWILSLLMGNANIVRVSQVDSEVKSLLLKVLAELFIKTEYEKIARNNVFLTWPHNDEITKAISHNADARMLWGSDESVAHIRKLACKVNCRDIVFSDKYSVAVVELDGDTDEAFFAEALSRDISAFSQRACSSPKVIFCCSESKTLPQAIMQRLNKLGSKNQFEPSRAVNHLVTEQLLKSSGVLQNSTTVPNIQVLTLNEFSPQMLNWHAGESQLYWVNLTSLLQLIDYIDEKCQTISYFGIEKATMLSIVEQLPINSVDRIVPLGRSLEFDVIWDGYELFSQLSRTITVN